MSNPKWELFQKDFIVNEDAITEVYVQYPKQSPLAPVENGL